MSLTCVSYQETGTLVLDGPLNEVDLRTHTGKYIFEKFIAWTGSHSRVSVKDGSVKAVVGGALDALVRH